MKKKKLKYKDLNIWGKLFVISETIVGIITVIILSPYLSYHLAMEKVRGIW